mmetsp:Transcript_16059/g.26067  ORF Transcript_16059/g.26067 Transcript_16059/m.26067 type:complete len:359 (-) Transcript_16059:63-1139(-)
MDPGSDEIARKQLDVMVHIGGELVKEQVAIFEENCKQNPGMRNLLGPNSLLLNDQTLQSLVEDDRRVELFHWEYDYSPDSTLSQGIHLDSREKLFHLSKWLLSAKGMHELERRKVPSEAVAMLLERAAALMSFHPRFLHIHLIGTKSGQDLPIMDRNGKADCYVKFRVLSLHPSEAKDQRSVEVRSGIAYKTLKPVWNEKLEISLVGGILGADGYYESIGTRQMVLIVEAWDADVGFWGIGLEIVKILTFIFVCLLVFGYVSGQLDSVLLRCSGTVNWGAIILVTGASTLMLGFAVCYLMAVVWKADDEIIGWCKVPLEMLHDQREHSLFLNLQKSDGKELKENDGNGVLRVKLSMSE